MHPTVQYLVPITMEKPSVETPRDLSSSEEAQHRANSGPTPSSIAGLVGQERLPQNCRSGTNLLHGDSSAKRKSMGLAGALSSHSHPLGLSEPLSSVAPRTSGKGFDITSFGSY
jgi:hypothetical protein